MCFKMKAWGKGFGLISPMFVYESCFLPQFSFRRQYEQLQTVIVRVLRPAAPASGSAQAVGGATTPTDQSEAGMETDDMSAVREVRLAYENVKVVDCLDLTPEGNASWEAALKRYSSYINIMFSSFIPGPVCSQYLSIAC